jgi:Holliday junction resolvasome RuvABC DNA-binding subunit
MRDFISRSENTSNAVAKSRERNDNANAKHFITATKQILFLKDMGYSDDEIINAISDNWDMSVFKVTTMVEYVLNKAHETMGEFKNE